MDPLCDRLRSPPGSRSDPRTVPRPRSGGRRNNDFFIDVSSVLRRSRRQEPGRSHYRALYVFVETIRHVVTSAAVNHAQDGKIHDVLVGQGSCAEILLATASARSSATLARRRCSSSMEPLRLHYVLSHCNLSLTDRLCFGRIG